MLLLLLLLLCVFIPIVMKTLLIPWYVCLFMSQWCDSENHDLPQHVIRSVKKKGKLMLMKVNVEQYLFPS